MVRTKTRQKKAVPSSFRDIAGFVFKDANRKVRRQILEPGLEDYKLMRSSGLYKELTQKKLILAHKELKSESTEGLVIEPEQIAFITYPFEWSFSQLKDAALLTLKIQKIALRHGMTLKDASAYNVQFQNGKPIFIDTLSFERYVPGTPWVAYRQFCQHFLAPLALMAYVDVNLSQLLRIHLDGVPLPLASKLLPKRARLKPGLAMHLVLHARAQSAKQSTHQAPSRRVGARQLDAILESLTATAKKLKIKSFESEWGDYYRKTNYTSAATRNKQKAVAGLIKKTKARTVLDLGGNDGTYCRPLHKLGCDTVCADIDPNAVESNYRITKHENDPSMLPLLIDLVNPGGGIGWRNQERPTINERLKTDVVMALALIHHLAISNNLPFSMIAQNLSTFAPYLVIEFVPKEDSQVKKLLATRRDIFASYNEVGFEAAFSEIYKIKDKVKIQGSKRTLYLMERY